VWSTARTSCYPYVSIFLIKCRPRRSHTDRPLCRALLSMSDTDPLLEEQAANPPRIHVIERLCSHLVDTSRDVEVSQIIHQNYKLASNMFHLQDFRSCILTCFAQISISQPDAHVALLGSTAVIPSLVVYLTRLTTPIWEDSEELVSSSSDTIALYACPYSIYSPRFAHFLQSHSQTKPNFVAFTPPSFWHHSHFQFTTQALLYLLPPF
jgi:hypothetical protein